MTDKKETLEQMQNRFHKERELEYKEAKEKISFQLRCKEKYYYAFQCAKFEKNLIKYGYDSYATQSSVAKEGLIFSEYKISLGDYHGHYLKTFNSKEEMFGFVIGYNDCISNLEYNTKLEVA